MRDSWNIGADGKVHYAVGGVGWACGRGSGGPVIGDATPTGPSPNGACTSCLGGSKQEDPEPRSVEQ